tara:strand:+ start:135 stop:4721 length:4587 start_codon:yes stop_codon:yes gene_type:complete
MQNLTNISNYLGEYKTGVDYKKFDFVYNKADGLYYYAKDDISWQEEYIVSDVNRFTLDPNGPLYNGLQTYYLFDAQNNMANYKIGQQIKIDGSSFTNDGRYKIINIEENYNPNAIKAGDYVLSEVLNGVEGLDDWFVSDWFLFGGYDFYWNGRDFVSYVDSYIDLFDAYSSSGTTLSKEQWGRQHYKQYGETENRSIPLAALGNWVYHIFLGWVYISNSSLDPSDKSVWFYINGDSKEENVVNPIWFFSKKDWADGNSAILAYEETAEDEYSFVKSDENKTFQDENTKEINVSSDGLTMLARDNSSITRYTKSNDSWNAGASLDFNGAFRYLACDEDCNTIAVLTYEDHYYVTYSGNNFLFVIEYNTDYEYNQGLNTTNIYSSSAVTSDSTISAKVFGVDWQKIEETGTVEKFIDFEQSPSTFKLKYAGDVKIYKYSDTSQSWELDHTVEKVVEKGLVANFSSDGNTLCFFEPESMEYSIFNNLIVAGTSQKISIYEYSGIQWEKTFGIDSSRYNGFLEEGNQKAADEFQYSLGITMVLRGGGTGAYYNGFNNAKNVIAMDGKFVNVDASSDYEKFYRNEGSYVCLSPDGQRLFYVDNNADIICIKKSIEYGWTKYKDIDGNNPEDIVWPVDIQRIITPEETKKHIVSGFLRTRPHNIKTNYDGTAVVTFGDNNITNIKNIFNEYTESYTKIGEVNEDSYIEEGDQWVHKKLIFPTRESGSSMYVNDLIFGESQSGNIRVAAVIGRSINPKKNYDLQYFEQNTFHLNLGSTYYGYRGTCVSMLELNDVGEWVSINGRELIENSIDLSANASLEGLINLEYNPSVIYKNELYNYTFGYNKFYTLGQAAGIVYAIPHNPSSSSIKDGLFDLYSIDQEQWYVYKNGRIYQDDINRAAPTININYQQSQVQELAETKNYGTRVWLKGSSNNDSVDIYEPRSTNEITITSENINPSVDSPDWVSDQFFFDADYGSSVTFRCENRKNQYSDGYYTYQPVGINSVKMEVDLQFKNRTNRETNAIIHFVESHLGQYDKDRASPNLKYNQGIDGFRWAGESTFHPYDSTDMQSKTFYCLDYSHSLNFENSNDISIKLNNFTTSLLNKSESLYVAGASSYSDNVYYQKNDVVLFEDNHKYYYCVSDDAVAGQSPATKTTTWKRNGGYFLEANKSMWTRDFLWKPSLGLKVSQKPRLKALSLTKDYTQIHRDGINENLLVLDLEFNNRTDDEARAILHYLEHHYGCVPFRFNAPAPYEKDRNFVCQAWTHTYNYKNNHSIKAKFEEFPFNLPADKYDAIVTQPILRESEFLIADSIRFDDNIENLKVENKFRKRITFRNTGDKDLTINNVSIEDGPFSIVAKFKPEDVPVLIEGKTYDHLFILPVSTALPFGLTNSPAKMFKQYSEGVAGGITFAVVDSSGNRVVLDGKPNSFLQNNTGTIKNLVTGESDSSYNGYINDMFIQNNKESTLKSGETGYIDVYYNGSLSVNDFNTEVEGIGGIIGVTSKEKTFYGELSFDVTHSDSSSETIRTNLSIQLYR